jgi:hypothetical protein
MVDWGKKVEEIPPFFSGIRAGEIKKAAVSKFETSCFHFKAQLRVRRFSPLPLIIYLNYYFRSYLLETSVQLITLKKASI